MQFLPQGFVILVAARVQHAQFVVIAVDDDFVHVLDVHKRLPVVMHARVARFGNQDADFVGIADHNRAVGHGLRANRHQRERADGGLQNRAARRQRIGG